VVLWRRLEEAGLDTVQLLPVPDGWRVSGATVFVYQGQPWYLEYGVQCDMTWRTRSAHVRGWAGESPIGHVIAVDHKRRWRWNGVERPELFGCIDVDLGLTPATNTLPLRRLELAVGSTAGVSAAWLSFPEFTLQRLEQRYTRVSEDSYHYESETAFTTTIKVDPQSLVVSYPPFWARVEAAHDGPLDPTSIKLRRD
jgi:hypothetical protein